MALLGQTLLKKVTAHCTLKLILIASSAVILLSIVNILGLTVAPKYHDDSEITSQFAPAVQMNLNSSFLKYKLHQKAITMSTILDEDMAERLINIAQMVRVRNIKCEAIFNTSLQKILMSDIPNLNEGSPIQDETYTKLTSDCKHFQLSRGYIMSSLTKEEANFPLAYSVLVFKEAEMVERLLKSIYRPQNYYCIHVDIKSPDAFYRAVSGIAECFPNVFLTSRRVDVRWGTFSVLEPELQCMEELWRYPEWKYFMSLTGQEFPLKTNFELVKILTAYDGANDIECTIKRANVKRWRNTLPPHGIKPIKGSVHITVNRDYVDYVLHNDTAQSLIKWVNHTMVPDETFFATLHCNPQLGIRGSYKGNPDSGKLVLTRFKHWHNEHYCPGKFVHRICILSTADLPELSKAKHLFANKFYLNKDRTVIGCLEEKLFNDTRDEYLGVKVFNAEYYTSLDFVKNKV